jgi:hypothetical protein
MSQQRELPAVTPRPLMSSLIRANAKQSRAEVHDNDYMGSLRGHA